MASLRKMLDALLDARLPKISVFTPDEATKLELCRQYGNFSLAYSTAVQPNLNYFGDSEGYIAYATKMGHTFVLGDPVAHTDSKPDYIKRFVASTNRPCFVQIGHETATVLSGLGYRINHMGVDTRLSLDSHNFGGKRNETVRYSEKWLLKKN
jgi:lysylphosphatidylglycerol synthetase-like protein (DUF2156 family)